MTVTLWWRACAASQSYNPKLAKELWEAAAELAKLPVEPQL